MPLVHLVETIGLAMNSPYTQPLGVGHEAGYYKQPGSPGPPGFALRAILFVLLLFLVAVAAARIALVYHKPCSHLFVLGVSRDAEAVGKTRTVTVRLQDLQQYTVSLSSNEPLPEEGDDVWLCPRQSQRGEAILLFTDKSRHITGAQARHVEPGVRR